MEARFNMAKNLRNYDFDYARAEQAAAPLVAAYPENPIFLLLVGDIEEKLGHNDAAAERFREAGSGSHGKTRMRGAVRKLASEALAR